MAQPARYIQIADDLRQQIESGELARESQIPTEVELQKKYNASRNTVRDAVKLLALEGLLETRGGREGTWVTPAHVTFVTTLSTDPKTGLRSSRSTGHPSPETGLRYASPSRSTLPTAISSFTTLATCRHHQRSPSSLSDSVTRAMRCESFTPNVARRVDACVG